MKKNALKNALKRGKKTRWRIGVKKRAQRVKVKTRKIAQKNVQRTRNERAGQDRGKERTAFFSS